jgi:hypothetical protein
MAEEFLVQALGQGGRDAGSCGSATGRGGCMPKWQHSGFTPNPDYSPKPVSLGAQAPLTLRHIPTQSKINSETEKHGALEYGLVCPNMSIRYPVLSTDRE